MLHLRDVAYIDLYEFVKAPENLVRISELRGEVRRKGVNSGRCAITRLIGTR